MNDIEENITRNERKKQKTKEMIVNVAIRLFKSQGVDATTMEQIAKEADIAKGTLYNYFSVKEAIIGEYIENSFKNKNYNRLMQFRGLKDTQSRMIHIFTELLEGIEDNKELFEKHLIYRMQQMIAFKDTPKEGLSFLAIEIIKMGQEEKEIRDDIPIDVLEEFFEFIFIEIVKCFYNSEGSFNQQEVIKRYTDLYISGVHMNKKLE